MNREKRKTNLKKLRLPGASIRNIRKARCINDDSTAVTKVSEYFERSNLTRDSSRPITVLNGNQIQTPDTLNMRNKPHNRLKVPKLIDFIGKNLNENCVDKTKITMPKKQRESRSSWIRNEKSYSKSLEQQCSYEHFNPHDIQLALAISMSEAENEGLVVREDLKLVPTNQKLRLDKRKGTETTVYSLLNKNCHKKLKWSNKLTPLTLRNSEVQNKKIEAEIEAFLIQQYNSQPPLDEKQYLTTYAPISNLLKQYQVSYKNKIIHCSELSSMANYYVVNLFEVTHVKPGHLLKDWNKIKGRDASYELLESFDIHCKPYVKKENINIVPKAMELVTHNTQDTGSDNAENKSIECTVNQNLTSCKNTCENKETYSDSPVCEKTPPRSYLQKCEKWSTQADNCTQNTGISSPDIFADSCVADFPIYLSSDDDTTRKPLAMKSFERSKIEEEVCNKLTYSSDSEGEVTYNRISEHLERLDNMISNKSLSLSPSSESSLLIISSSEKNFEEPDNMLRNFTHCEEIIQINGDNVDTLKENPSEHLDNSITFEFDDNIQTDAIQNNTEKFKDRESADIISQITNADKIQSCDPIIPFKHLDTEKSNDTIKNINISSQANLNCTPENVEIKGKMYSVRVIKSSKPEFMKYTKAELLKELYRYGIKPLNRKLAVKILEYIYNHTHPKMQKSENNIGSTNHLKDPNTVRNKEFKPTNAQYEKSNAENTNITENALCLRDCFYGNTMHLTHESCTELLNDENYILHENKKQKMYQVQLPLHVAWHNLLCSSPALHEAVLMYKPINVYEIYIFFKTLGLHYKLNDLRIFLDRRSVLFYQSNNK